MNKNGYLNFKKILQYFNNIKIVIKKTVKFNKNKIKYYI